MLASAMAFEINKVTLRIRRSLTPRSSSPATYETDASDEFKTPSSTQSTARASHHRALCAELSSFALYPVFGALSPSHYSSPYLLFPDGHKTSCVRIHQLEDDNVHRILKLLDAKTLIAFTQTCRRFRRIAAQHEDELPRLDVSAYEMIVAYNQQQRRVDVRALRRGRSFGDVVIVGTSISDVLAPHTRALTKITFDVGVIVTDLIPEILYLHQRQRLAPLSLSFTGGALTKGNHVMGADLRFLTEYDFIQLVGRLQPHLQEVQMATSRLFRISTSPPRLLGLISLLSSFGIVYERPAVRFFFEDIAKITAFWRNDPLSRSCDLYIRRPHDGTFNGWKNLGTVDDYREDNTTDLIISRVTVRHSFLVNIELIFHLH